MIRITWYGHAAFLIECDGTRIIMDPYSSRCGLPPIGDHAAVVTVSHVNEKFHSCTSELTGVHELVNGLEIGLEGREVCGIRFRGIEVFEDDKGGGDANAIVYFDLDNVRIAHLGDLGHGLGQRELSALEGTDVLLALAGGPPTIGMVELRDLVDALKPSVVIPMHFKLPGLDLGIHDIEPFLAVMEGLPIINHDSASLEIESGKMPARSTVHVLEAMRTC